MDIQKLYTLLTIAIADEYRRENEHDNDIAIADMDDEELFSDFIIYAAETINVEGIDDSTKEMVMITLRL